MASNVGITLAKIRAGTGSFQLDDSTFSEEIKVVQKALYLTGYWTSPSGPDGKYGGYSISAAKGFQSENSLPVNGNMDKATLSKLETAVVTLYVNHSKTPSEAAMRTGFDYAVSGDSGAGVNKIRALLISKGYSLATTGPIEGPTGPMVTAIKDFQSKNQLTSDGSVGQQTFLALENTTSSTGWFVNNKAALTPGLLARCGFKQAILRPEFVSKVNNVLNLYNVNTKEKVKHFLSQCLYETAYGASVMENTYQVGVGGVKSYSPFYGAGFIHLTHDYNYNAFALYMKNTRGVTDAKITSPAAFATLHVAIKYPDHSAGWCWDVGFKFNQNIVWSDTAMNISYQLTKTISGSTATQSQRYGFYQNIGLVLK